MYMYCFFFSSTLAKKPFFFFLIIKWLLWCRRFSSVVQHLSRRFNFQHFKKKGGGASPSPLISSFTTKPLSKKSLQNLHALPHPPPKSISSNLAKGTRLLLLQTPPSIIQEQTPHDLFWSFIFQISCNCFYEYSKAFADKAMYFFCCHIVSYVLFLTFCPVSHQLLEKELFPVAYICLLTDVADWLYQLHSWVLYLEIQQTSCSTRPFKNVECT